MKHEGKIQGQSGKEKKGGGGGEEESERGRLKGFGFDNEQTL